VLTFLPKKYLSPITSNNPKATAGSSSAALNGSSYPIEEKVAPEQLSKEEDMVIESAA